MLNEFCTLFDVNYLPRALVLYRSLERVCGDGFRLRAYCMDEAAERLLRRLALPRLAVVPLAELERHDPDLHGVKGDRTQMEYCWTATPAICLHALEREPELEAITYLDADLMFFHEPRPLFEELGDGSVMIVPHRYAPEWQAWEAASGTYNVEWLTFRRDPRGLRALRWWRDRCLEWCYFRYEDGKMGDQKYLDDWPTRFEGVHVLEHPGGGLAPWNLPNHVLERRNGDVSVDGRELVFFHYQSLRLYAGLTTLRRLGFWDGTFEYTDGAHPLVWTHGYPIRGEARPLVWEPYLRRLGEAVAEIRRVDPGFDAGFVRLDARRLLYDEARRRARGLGGRVARGVRQRLPVAPGTRRSWQAPRVAEQMLTLTGGQLARPEDVPPFRTFLRLTRVLLDEFPLPEPARILDVGCGTGHYSELLERNFPGRFEYTGADAAESMVATARSAFPGRTFVVDDVLHSQLDLGSFDVVLAGALIDVLPDWEPALGALLGSQARYVVLHRQRLVDGPTRVERVAGYDGQQTFATFLDRHEVEALVWRHGRTIARTFPVEGDIVSLLLPLRERDRA